MTAPTPIAYVVDDDEAIRTLWRWLMESNGFAAQTFSTAMQFIESYQGGPGCLVLDLRLPGMSGLELQQYLKQKGLEIPIVFVTGHGDVPTAVNALKGGAVDFIQKPFDYREALATVQRAFERDAHSRKQREKQEQFSRRLAGLTGREREVMQRVIEGKANKVIAEEMDISIRTVEYHRANVMEKMGVGSVAALTQLIAFYGG